MASMSNPASDPNAPAARLATRMCSRSAGRRSSETVPMALFTYPTASAPKPQVQTLEGSLAGVDGEAAVAARPSSTAPAISASHSRASASSRRRARTRQKNTAPVMAAPAATRPFLPNGTRIPRASELPTRALWPSAASRREHHAGHFEQHNANRVGDRVKGSKLRAAHPCGDGDELARDHTGRGEKQREQK